MLRLKRYQARALEVLGEFLRDCQRKSIDEAFQTALLKQDRHNEFYHRIFDDVPAICLRLPTGGGKTLLGAHCVALAAKEMLETDAPVALWLTPSETIRLQTLSALGESRHPYRQALASYFGDRVWVCGLEGIPTINPHDLGKACIVVVATIQSFNVSDTSKRNVYSFLEDLAPHFENIPTAIVGALEKVAPADLESQPYLTRDDLDRVKHSIANWFHVQAPIVIVDEAHNNRTDRFFNTLGRLNPSCVVELTATPIKGNNVLYQVTAQELKAEEMIKLPIILAEHPTGWREAVRDAVLTRDRLETIAQNESDYVRPIALIQAAPKGEEATVEEVRKYLLEAERVPESHIAVATGAQKELHGIDLFDRRCQIRYVITVEALKEGWDCSFAYVLASLQTIRSAKDVEQLLGRVLRMPYAKTRAQAELNRAYAHIVANSFAEAAANLKDRMVQNMGFERIETDSLLLPQQGGLFPKAEADKGHRYAMPDCYIQIPALPMVESWPDDLRRAVRISETSQGATVLISGSLDPMALSRAEELLKAGVDENHRDAIAEQFKAHRAVRRAMEAPAQLGAGFASIPQLCLELDGFLEVVEPAVLAALGEWDLLGVPIRLDGFAIRESVNSFEIDLNGERVHYRAIDANQLHLNEVPAHAAEEHLVIWLDRQLRKPYLSQIHLQTYLTKLITHLVMDRGMSLTALVRSRVPLSIAIDSEIERQRWAAVNKSFQAWLPSMTVRPPDEPQFSFRFNPGQYPARNAYQGRYEFKKHFYPLIHNLREKTGSGKRSEEFMCAQALDNIPEVKHWVRNVERQERFSFWLPTSTDHFYPDFVAELNDGRVLVVEYKGEVYKTNDDSREKKLVGAQWERASRGRCLFLFAVAEDEAGRSVFDQIAHKVRHANADHSAPHKNGATAAHSR
jgi:type III restriction enzyme